MTSASLDVMSENRCGRCSTCLWYEENASPSCLGDWASLLHRQECTYWRDRYPWPGLPAGNEPASTEAVASSTPEER